MAPEAAESIIGTHFGEMDRNANGDIASEYPAWYIKGNYDDLKDTVLDMKSRLRRAENGEISFPSEEDKAEFKRELARTESRLASIESSRPNMTDAASKRYSKVYDYLTKEIKALMFTRNADHRGTTDAAKEAELMTMPVVKVPDEDFASIAKACGVERFPIVQGVTKITRNDAVKIWKQCGRLLDAETNVEVLRKDG